MISWDLTRILLTRACADKERLHIIYAQGSKLPNDEILSASMVAFVLEKYGLKNIRIVDGGINAATAAECAEAGATWFVAGSAIFGSDDPAATFREIARAAGCE